MKKMITLIIIMVIVLTRFCFGSCHSDCNKRESHQSERAGEEYLYCGRGEWEVLLRVELGTQSSLRMESMVISQYSKHLSIPRLSMTPSSNLVSKRVII